jgi:hypothetical protein
METDGDREREKGRNAPATRREDEQAGEQEVEVLFDGK